VVRLPDLVAPETRGGLKPRCANSAMCQPARRRTGESPDPFDRRAGADDRQFDLRRYGAGLSDELEPLGYAVILAQSRYDAAREDHMLSALLSRRPEAIIMVARPQRRMGAAAAARRNPRRGNLGSSGGAGRRRAGFNNYEAGVTVARPSGWRKAATVLRSSAATIRAPRGAGMVSTTRRRALGVQGATPAGAWTATPSGSVVALAELPGVDAVFCAANDAHAIGFMSVCARPACWRNGPAASNRSRHRPRRSRNGPPEIAPSLSTIRSMAMRSGAPLQN